MIKNIYFPEEVSHEILNFIKLISSGSEDEGFKYNGIKYFYRKCISNRNIKGYYFEYTVDNKDAFLICNYNTADNSISYEEWIPNFND